MGCGLLNAVLAMPRKNADHVLSSLESTHQRLQYAAELAYLRGDFRPAAQRFFDVESGNETKICAARLGIMAAIACGDFGLYQKIEPFLEHCLHSESEQTRFYAQMTLAAPALNLFLPEAAPMPQLDHENHFDLSGRSSPDDDVSARQITPGAGEIHRTARHLRSGAAVLAKAPTRSPLFGRFICCCSAPRPVSVSG